MTYPAYPPAQPQQPAYPPQQPQQYPPQQPAYPPQQPVPGTAYYPPPQQQYAPPPPPRGSIDSFYDQPANSGKSISSWFQTPGQSLTGTVARELTDADTQLQTDMQTKQPLPPRPDGSRRWTMTVPLLVAPSPDFPEGRAAWIVSSTDRSDLDAAMQAAGCPPKTVPEAGAVITITFLGYRLIPGFGAPKKVKQISYQRPAAASGNGQIAVTAVPQPLAPPPPAQQAPPQYTDQAQQPQYLPTPPAPPQQYQQGYQQYGPPPATQTAPPAPPQPQYQQQPGFPPANTAPAPSATPPGAPPTGAASPSNGQQYAVPADLTPEQAERLRQLTGGQQ